ncbi:MAG: DNA repair protein RecN, partial [Spirochaetia bacterium]|nr:DNA repair protein RecN [Spirochaetia bacterium]
VHFDRQRLNEVEERITAIEALLKKYKKSSVRELKEYHEELKREKKSIELSEDAIREKEKERDVAVEKMAGICARLGDIRRSKAKLLGKAVEEELADLGISRGVFTVRVSRIEAGQGDTLTALIGGVKCRLTPQGTDEAEFMISLNPGEEVKPLVKIASGGEVSRIMLAIKNILASADPVPVMVFDEIDTGISGKTAGVVGKKLREISRKKQLICITHLPQIAACADIHYSVEKSVEDGKTRTRIVKLGSGDRIGEVAKLLSGDTVTDASLLAAGELIEAAKRI